MEYDPVKTLNSLKSAETSVYSLSKHSIKDAKYNICEKAGWNQVVYCIKNIQHSMSVYTVHSYINIYIYKHCRQSQKEDYHGSLTLRD